MKERILYKLNSIVIVLIFCSAIYIPFTVGIIERDRGISLVEKRKLTKFPKISNKLKDIKSFPGLFDTYYSDHFGLRDWFTSYYKLVKYRLGDSPSKRVTIGKNGWLFLGSIKKDSTNPDDPIGDVRNVNRYSQKELDDFAQRMTSLKFWLNDQGIEYVFVIAPNKHTIYFDQLPYFISKVNEKSATDQLFEYLREHTDVSVVDLRPKLIEGKKKYQIYYKTGTHWNFMGGNIAQYEIMKVIKKMFPTKISPELYSSSIFEFDIATDRALERLSGIHPEKPCYAPYPVFESNTKPINDFLRDANGKFIGNTIHTNINTDEKLNVVIFRDSFFRVLEPYFNRKFKRSTYILEELNYPSLKKYIDLEKPDIIIEAFAERKLPYVPKTFKEFNRF